MAQKCDREQKCDLLRQQSQDLQERFHKLPLNILQYVEYNISL